MFELYAHFNGELLINFIFPSNRHDLLTLSTDIAHISAGVDVDHDAFASADVADDGVAGNRSAASGIGDYHTLSASDRQGTLVVNFQRFVL